MEVEQSVISVSSANKLGFFFCQKALQAKAALLLGESIKNHRGTFIKSVFIKDIGIQIKLQNVKLLFYLVFSF